MLPYQYFTFLLLCVISMFIRAIYTSYLQLFSCKCLMKPPQTFTLVIPLKLYQ